MEQVGARLLRLLRDSSWRARSRADVERCLHEGRCTQCDGPVRRAGDRLCLACTARAIEIH